MKIIFTIIWIILMPFVGFYGTKFIMTHIHNYWLSTGLVMVGFIAIIYIAGIVKENL